MQQKAAKKKKPTTSQSSKMLKVKTYSKKLRISYWWKCDTFPKGIPPEIQERLDEDANERLVLALKEGWTSGELISYVHHKIDGVETPEDGFYCHGWFEISSS